MRTVALVADGLGMVALIVGYLWYSFRCSGKDGA